MSIRPPVLVGVRAPTYPGSTWPLSLPLGGRLGTGEDDEADEELDEDDEDVVNDEENP